MNISKGLTAEEFFAGKPGVYYGYAPAADKNNPSVYAGNVSTWMGIPRDVPLSELLEAGDRGGNVAASPSPWSYDVVEGTPDEEKGLSTSAKIGLGIGAALLLAMAV